MVVRSPHTRVGSRPSGKGVALPATPRKPGRENDASTEAIVNQLRGLTRDTQDLLAARAKQQGLRAPDLIALIRIADGPGMTGAQLSAALGMRSQLDHRPRRPAAARGPHQPRTAPNRPAPGDPQSHTAGATSDHTRPGPSALSVSGRHRPLGLRRAANRPAVPHRGQTRAGRIASPAPARGNHG